MARLLLLAAVVFYVVTIARTKQLVPSEDGQSLANVVEGKDDTHPETSGPDEPPVIDQQHGIDTRLTALQQQLMKKTDLPIQNVNLEEKEGNEQTGRLKIADNIKLTRDLEERHKGEIDILNEYIHGLENSLQDKVEAAVEEGLDPIQDCSDILRLNPEARSGMHYMNIHKAGGQSERFLVYCDMETAGGGWTVIQRRQSDAINFDRDFQTYKEGFGVMTSDFWIGNENLHMITSRWNYELRVELESFQGEKRTANYGLFRINCDNYKMEVDFYSGDAGDALQYNNGMFFTTRDHDMDNHPDLNCANQHFSGWWHNACTQANLNGRFHTNPTSDEQGMFWYHWQGHMSLQSTEMKIRPASFKHASIPSNCADILQNDPLAASGPYTIPIIEHDCIRSMNVYCDMNTDGGGWTVFQRRIDGSVDFFRNYQSYMDGFGDVTGEFYLGNENIHRLTSRCDQDLRFDLMDENNDRRYAQYATFHVGPDDDSYRVHFTTYSGTAGDAFTYHNNRVFSTYDRNHWNCAQAFEAAWWYNNCLHSNLNGRYYTQSPPSTGIYWSTWTGSGVSRHLRFTEMKIRPSGECD